MVTPRTRRAGDSLACLSTRAACDLSWSREVVEPLKNRLRFQKAAVPEDIIALGGQSILVAGKRRDRKRQVVERQFCHLVLDGRLCKQVDLWQPVLFEVSDLEVGLLLEKGFLSGKRPSTCDGCGCAALFLKIWNGAKSEFWARPVWSANDLYSY